MKRYLPLILLLAAPAFAQTVTLTPSLATGTGVTPILTWSSTPAGASCVGSGDAAWAGTKAAAGTQTLAKITTGKTYVITCTWLGDTTAIVSWTAPTQNNDGTPYTNPGGFRLMYGKTNTEAGLDTSAYVQDPAARSWTSPTLTAGVWYFGIKVFNSMGIEGPLSNIASKTITTGATASDTASIQFPGTVILTVK
jgi:hypothetical protein